MSRRSLLLTLATLLLAIAGLSGLFYVLVRYEPAWYVKAAVSAGAVRSSGSQEFNREFFDFISAVGGDEPVWWGHFTQEQINSYFEEDFIQSGLDRRLLPEAISQPRLCFEPDMLRLGFRYGSGAWSTVIAVDLRVWLPAEEPNVMALELVGLHAGVLPIKALSILERIAQAARDNNIEVTWYRYNGHPVALIRFQADQPRVTMLLQAVALDEGSIEIRGCSPEGTPARASLPPAEPALPGLQIDAN